MNKAQKKPLQLQDSLAVRILICVLFPLIAFAVLLLSQGKSPLVAYQTIITSIFGSAYGFGEVIVRAAYLILTGLAASIPARVGLANAGGEGQMAIAALGTAVAAAETKKAHSPSADKRIPRAAALQRQPLACLCILYSSGYRHNRISRGRFPCDRE